MFIIKSLLGRIFFKILSFSILIEKKSNYRFFLYLIHTIQHLKNIYLFLVFILKSIMDHSKFIENILVSKNSITKSNKDSKMKRIKNKNNNNTLKISSFHPTSSTSSIMTTMETTEDYYIIEFGYSRFLDMDCLIHQEGYGYIIFSIPKMTMIDSNNIVIHFLNEKMSYSENANVELLVITKAITKDYFKYMLWNPILSSSAIDIDINICTHHCSQKLRNQLILFGDLHEMTVDEEEQQQQRQFSHIEYSNGIYKSG